MRITMRMIRLWVSCLGALAFGITAVGHAWAEGRVLTPSDVVSIKVVGQPDLDVATRVEVDGTINFPYVGRIKAAGTTEDALARIIEKRLAARQIVTDPHVLVEVTNFGTQVSVQGQVGAPGVYTIDRTTNLSQALARAGGLRDTAGTVILRRHGREMRYNGKDLMTGKINGDAILVQNNDEIYVESGAVLLRLRLCRPHGRISFAAAAYCATSHFHRGRALLHLAPNRACGSSARRPMAKPWKCPLRWMTKWSPRTRLSSTSAYSDHTAALG